jgi:translation initiation factor 2 subunit 1
MVLRVDKEKGYIDLSRLFRVSQEEIVVCEERFDKSKMAHGVLRHVARRCNMPVKQLYESVAWPLCKLHRRHVLDAR